MEYQAQDNGVAPYHLIVEGRARLEMDGRDAIELVAGDMLMLPRGHRHRLGAGTPAQAAAILTLLPGGEVAQIGNQGSGPLTDILCGQFHYGTAAAGTLIGALPDIVLIRTAGRADFVGLQALVTLLRDEASSSRPGASAVVSHLASALFSLILRAWLEQAGAVPGLFTLLADGRLSKALNEMLAEPEKAWSMEQLAQRCNMSRSTFVRMFRKVSGTTPGDLLMRMRMAQASIWLQQANLGVGEISEAVGYNSEAAFNRAFKRYMGAGPGQYRRSTTSVVGRETNAALYWSQ
jgi:AraC family transcriptional activator of mtrCDE